MLTDYFKEVMKEEYLVSCSSRTFEKKDKPTKRPVQRSRKRPLELPASGQQSPCRSRFQHERSDTDAQSTDLDPVNKSIRCQYTLSQKQRAISYARHHGIRPTQRKFRIPRKNIQQWMKAYQSGEFQQNEALKRGPKKL